MRNSLVLLDQVVLFELLLVIVEVLFSKFESPAFGWFGDLWFY